MKRALVTRLVKESKRVGIRVKLLELYFIEKIMLHCGQECSSYSIDDYKDEEVRSCTKKHEETKILIVADGYK